MYISKLSLFQFKNYETLDVVFEPKINCIAGENGAGKTNLLDALHYLSMSKSYFLNTDSQNILHNQNMMMIKANFHNTEENFEIYCAIQTGQKKILKVNDVLYSKITEHIGRFPVVMIAPSDQDLIAEGSEDRRRFLDSLISQIDSQYLQNLIHYNHYLAQRNAILKQNTTIDNTLIEMYDKYLLNFGEKITQKRQLFMEEFLPIFQKNYDFLTQKKEKCHFEYKADFLLKDFKNKYYQAFQKDVMLKRTTFGTHKDDIVFFIDNYPLKKYGSQGQQKSFLIALKLAQYEIIYQKKQFKPILLLDDIFDKLDDFRIQQLIKLVNNETFGQIFVTDARPERTSQIFATIEIKPAIFTIQNGKLI
ncbi:MAG: DNA replication and repair protein RecF [Bacteroidetes bacterium]|nr:MAG: DNA replication and repair protein RecF [Bacteroidota bacterium]TAG93469.1 MAG: DNA replication and repair protein RecF [Bacteroidota bacterium]